MESQESGVVCVHGVGVTSEKSFFANKASGQEKRGFRKLIGQRRGSKQLFGFFLKVLKSFKKLLKVTLIFYSSSNKPSLEILSVNEAAIPKWGLLVLSTRYYLKHSEIVNHDPEKWWWKSNRA